MPDLISVKQITGTPRMEVHVMGRPGDFGSFVLEREIPIATDETPGRWEFMAADFDGSGQADLYLHFCHSAERPGGDRLNFAS